MTYKERECSLFLGLPVSLTVHMIDEHEITTRRGLFRQTEDSAYMYSIQEVRLEVSFLERILGLGTVKCKGYDITDPVMVLRHIHKAAEIKNFILACSEKDKKDKKIIPVMSIDGKKPSYSIR